MILSKDVAMSINDSLRIASATHRIAWINWRTERYEDANSVIDEYQKIVFKLKNADRHKIAYYISKTKFLYELGDLNKARIYADSTIDFAYQMNDNSYISTALSNKTVYYKNNDYINYRIDLINGKKLANSKKKDKI